MADHVRVREVDDRERVAVADLLDEPVGELVARTSPASCRSSATSRGEGTRMRVSPGNSSSRPPLKKYVTCAYFSVSAACSWRTPCSASTSAITISTSLLREADREVEVLAVFRHRRQVDAELDRASRDSCRPRSGRKLKKIAVSVAGSRRGRPSSTIGLDELVGDAARRSSPAPPRSGRRRARPCRRRSRRARAGSAPSACRGPWRSSGRRRSRSVRRAARRDRARRSAATRRARP